MYQTLDMYQTFEDLLGLPADTVNHLLGLSLDAVWEHEAVLQVVNSLDVGLLKGSQASIQPALASFYQWLGREQGVARASTSSSWGAYVVNLLEGRLAPGSLSRVHMPLANAFIEDGVPHLVEAFEMIEPAEVRQEWQKAISVFCLLLVAGARQ